MTIKIKRFVTHWTSTLDFLRDPQRFYFHLASVLLYSLAFFCLFNGKNLQNGSKLSIIKMVRYASLVAMTQAHYNTQHIKKKKKY